MGMHPQVMHAVRPHSLIHLPVLSCRRTPVSSRRKAGVAEATGVAAGVAAAEGVARDDAEGVPCIAEEVGGGWVAGVAPCGL